MEFSEPVRKRLEELRKKYNHTVTIKVIKGGNYVYQVYTGWNLERTRRIRYTIYLGKIEDDGTFVGSVRRSKPRTRGVKNVGGYVRKRHAETREEMRKEEEYENSVILSELALNARISFLELGKLVGLSPAGVRNRIKSLEKRFNIIYTIDTHIPQNFGFDHFIMTVKFRNKRPTIESIKKALRDSPNVQFAATTNGIFDLFIYVLFENSRELEKWMYIIRKSDTFSDYDAKWNTTYLWTGHGIILMRDEFFESVIKNKVWYRTRESPRIRPGQVYKRQYATMRELSKNGRIPFKDIDRIHNLKRASADYTFHELMKNGTIRKATISLQNLPIKYLAIIIIHQEIGRSRSEKTRKDLLLYGCMDKLWSNRFIVTGDIGSPVGVLSIAPIYEDGELEKIVEDMRRITKERRIDTAIITDSFLGTVCINKLETIKTDVGEVLKRDYNMSEEDITKALAQQNKIN